MDEAISSVNFLSVYLNIHADISILCWISDYWGRNNMLMTNASHTSLVYSKYLMDVNLNGKEKKEFLNWKFLNHNHVFALWSRLIGESQRWGDHHFPDPQYPRRCCLSTLLTHTSSPLSPFPSLHITFSSFANVYFQCSTRPTPLEPEKTILLNTEKYL